MTTKAEYQKRYRDRHPERVAEAARKSRLKNREALNKQQRERGKKNQVRDLPKQRVRRGLPVPTRPCPSACEVCAAPPGKKAIALDHNHETGAFRGWLCGPCNLAIGNAKDSPQRLRALAAYLETN